MAAALDSKSSTRKSVWVQVPSPVPKFRKMNKGNLNVF